MCTQKKDWKRERGKEHLWMHVTCLFGSHVLSEEQPKGFSGAVVVLLSFAFW
jgi:hypothetical protein